MNQVVIKGQGFEQNGQPIRILAGAMHYFRVVPEYWRDRMIKLKAMGLNTLETYVCWNLHEPKPGKFEFDGQLDLVRYIEMAAELGLMVIVRPGPYICSEWDFGGLPAWLLKDPAMRVRCAYPPYLKAVDRFFDALLTRLAPLQASRGGPIVAMQVENEYGSYGSDKTYLRHLADGMRSRGIDCLLFTADGPSDFMLTGGTLPGLFKVVNFGSHSEEAFRKLREHQPDGPVMCGEFWNGWFDHWGNIHHKRDLQEVTQVLDTMLAAGASVSFYMFHGGTNFGFMAGANHDGTTYKSDVTSYDYGAPLGEAGDPTPKFFAFRDVIRKYAPVPDGPLPAQASRRAFGQVELTETARLLDNLERLSRQVRSAVPLTMEALGQDYGFIHYRTMVQGPREKMALELQGMHDRALVFVNGAYRGVIDRNDKESTVQLEFGPGQYQLEILVENMARINYGPLLHDRKGISDGVRLGNQFLFDWTIFPLTLKNLRKLKFTAASGNTGPLFYRGVFKVNEPADTFLALPGWTKGVVWLNGFNLGRYWEEKGPQHTLYVPAPKLRKGRNELIVLELHSTTARTVEFRDAPDLG
ncbi:MAG: glycoside hydrolase family 35 protein [bacterium]